MQKIKLPFDSYIFFLLAYVVTECRWEFKSKIVNEAEYVEGMGEIRN